MRRQAVLAARRDRHGVVSLEYALLAAAVVTALIAGTGTLQQRMDDPFNRIQNTATAPSVAVRFSPF